MRITLVGPVYPYRGGIAHYTTLLAQHLQASGHDVQVISFRRQYPAWLYPGETDRDISQNPLLIPADFLLDPLYPWTWLTTAARIARNGPDLVVMMWWTTFWAPALAMLARRLRGLDLRVAFLIHNVMPHEARPWDRWLSRLALRSTDRYILLSEREAARLRKLLPAARPVITPLPIYNLAVSQVPSRPEARSALGLPEEAPVILFFGIVRPYKGLVYLVQAFKDLLLTMPAARLVIAGEFWEPVSGYDQLIDGLGIRDRVQVHNRYIPNEEVPLFFSAADIFVAPYIDGTQSAAVKMALGFRLPVVMTRCIMDEALKGRANIWLVEERSPHSLLEAMRNALSQPEALKTGLPEDDWGQMVGVIIDLSKAA